MKNGRKDDAGKPDYLSRLGWHKELLAMAERDKRQPGRDPGAYIHLAMSMVNEGLFRGGIRYGNTNFVNVCQERYAKALLRHLKAHIGGEMCDKDTGVEHMALVATNAILMLASEACLNDGEAQRFGKMEAIDAPET